MGVKVPSFVWTEDYPAAVTVCDSKGIIIAMNRQAIEQFKKRGGEQLIGSSLFSCHPESANRMIRSQLETQQANIYITQTKTGYKLVQQVPWYRDGTFAGLVETISPVNGNIPVKQRD